MLNALAVGLIQSGDAALMYLARFIATDFSRAVPFNMFAIHDASITTAGSTLLFKNAYDNIAPHLLARRGSTRGSYTNDGNNPSVFKQIEKSMTQSLEKAIAYGYNNGSVNISPVNTRTSSGELTNYAGVTAYFDELYLRVKNDNFFSESELAREHNQVSKRRMNKQAIAAIDAAERYGYKVPEPNNETARQTLSVSADNFKNLIETMMEHSGIAEYDQYVHMTKGMEEDQTTVVDSKKQRERYFGVKEVGLKQQYFGGPSRNRKHILKFADNDHIDFMRDLDKQNTFNDNLRTSG